MIRPPTTSTTIPPPLPMRFESFTRKLSFCSTARSARTSTVIFLRLSPGENVRVPKGSLSPTKSPALAEELPRPATAQGSSSVRRPLRSLFQCACVATTATREALASSVRDCIRLWCRTGSGAAKVFSLGPRLPKARRAFADPFASLFQWASTTLHTDFSALKHPILVGTPTASGRQKSPRVGRSGPRLVEPSPIPSPPFSSGPRRRSTLASVRSLNSHLRCGEEFEVEHERCVGRNARC